AFFGTGSDAFEPNVTVPAASARRSEDERPRAAAPVAVTPYAAAAPAAPVTSRRRRDRRELPASAGSDEGGLASAMRASLVANIRSDSDRTEPDRSGECPAYTGTVATEKS